MSGIDYFVAGPAAPAFDAPRGSIALRLSDEFVFINTSGGAGGWFDIAFNIDVADQVGDLAVVRAGAPGINDDFGAGFKNGDLLIQTGVSPNRAHILVDQTTGAAVWRAFSGLLAGLDTVDSAQIDTDAVIEAKIGNNAVTNAKLANSPAKTVKGNDTVSSADPKDLTQTEVTTLINEFTSVLQGVVPASGGGIVNFLRADGTWAIPFPEYLFFADQLDNPNNADWAVNALAPVDADSNNNALKVRRYDDTAEEGSGLIVEVPAGAVNVIFLIKSRAETAPGAVRTVGLKVYERDIGDNVVVGAWSAGVVLTDINIPTNERFQYDSQTLTLAAVGLVAGQTHQLEVTRVAPTGGTDLEGDWDLLSIGVKFS
jgi:hypothetical protein